MNTVILVGNVGRKDEIETINFSNGSFEKIRFSVADNFHKGQEKGVNWFKIEVIGKKAKFVDEKINPGDKVMVQGKLESYNIDGKGTYWTVKASEVEKMNSDTMDRVEIREALAPRDQPANFDDIPF